jgi:hypothetical protein
MCKRGKKMERTLFGQLEEVSSLGIQLRSLDELILALCQILKPSSLLSIFGLGQKALSLRDIHISVIRHDAFDLPFTGKTSTRIALP